MLQTGQTGDRYEKIVTMNCVSATMEIWARYSRSMERGKESGKLSAGAEA